MRVELPLTAEQAAVVVPLLRPSVAVLGRVMREPFNGTNANACGRLILELGTVPESSLPRLREAIAKANRPRRGTASARR